jgi:hypothetical protein
MYRQRRHGSLSALFNHCSVPHRTCFVEERLGDSSLPNTLIEVCEDKGGQGGEVGPEANPNPETLVIGDSERAETSPLCLACVPAPTPFSASRNLICAIHQAVRLESYQPLIEEFGICCTTNSILHEKASQ